MKKNYMKPMAKCIDMRLENILAGSNNSIEPGKGEGPHDAASKKFSFDDDDAF